MKPFHTFVIAMVLLTGASFPGPYVYSPLDGEASEKDRRLDAHEVVLRVEGMTCKVCPLTIRTALKSLTGVVDADVSYENSEAIVTYESGEVTVDRIITTIENTGKYKVVIKEL